MTDYANAVLQVPCLTLLILRPLPQCCHNANANATLTPTLTPTLCGQGLVRVKLLRDFFLDSDNYKAPESRAEPRLNSKLNSQPEPKPDLIEVLAIPLMLILLINLTLHLTVPSNGRSVDLYSLTSMVTFNCTILASLFEF